MTTTTKKQVPSGACRFRGEDFVQLELDDSAPPEGQKGPRKFRMVANTGKVISSHGWWGALGIDLDGVAFKQKLPALKDHDTEKPVGFTTKVERSDAGLVAEGQLLDTEHARQVTELADQGFPWQASVRFEPVRVQVLVEGEEAEVNGQTMTGPGHVLRESVLREVTFTALGADDDTTAEPLAKGGQLEAVFFKSEDDTMTEKQNPPAPPAALSAAQVLEQHPTAAAELEQKGRQLGIEAERARALAILQTADPAQLELALELVKSGASLEQAALKLAGDLRTRLAAATKAALGATETPLGADDDGEDGDGEDGADATLTGDAATEKWTNEWKRNAHLRASFTDLKTYLAFRRNQHRTRLFAVGKED